MLDHVRPRAHKASLNLHVRQMDYAPLILAMITTQGPDGKTVSRVLGYWNVSLHNRNGQWCVEAGTSQSRM